MKRKTYRNWTTKVTLRVTKRKHRVHNSVAFAMV